MSNRKMNRKEFKVPNGSAQYLLLPTKVARIATALKCWVPARDEEGLLEAESQNNSVA